MKLTALALAITASVAVAHSAHAKEFQHQLDLGYLEYDVGDNEDAHLLHLSGTHYFAPVDTTGLPLREAAFLRKANSLSIGYSQFDSEDEFSEDTEKLRSVDVGYYIPNTMFYVGGSVSQFKEESTFEYYDGERENYQGDWESHWIARLGITPTEGLLVWTEFYKDTDISDYPNINAKYVKPLVNDTAVGIEARAAKETNWDSRQLELIADYYFNSRFSVGAGVFHSEQDSFGSETDSLLRTSYFLTDSFSLSATYVNREYVDHWMLEASIRF